MTTHSRSGAQRQPRTRQQPRQGALAQQGFARLMFALVVAVLLALSATGCGHHFHVTFHASQQTGSRASRH